MNTIRTPTTSQYVIPAFDRKQIGAAGQFLACLEGTDLFYVSFNGGGEFLFGPGLYYKCTEFTEYNQIDIINKTANPLTVTVVWGFGEYQDKRLTASGTLKIDNAPGNMLKVQTVSPSTFETALDFSTSNVSAVALAANPNRREAFITNLDDALTVYVGGPSLNGTTTRGIKVSPGQTIILTHTDDVYAVAPIGAPKIGISYTEA